MVDDCDEVFEQIFEGLIVVVMGSLEGFSCDEVKEVIVLCGGKVVGFVF